MSDSLALPRCSPVEYPPGVHFVYQSGASYMLSAISGHTFILLKNEPGYKTISFDFYAADFCRVRILDAHGEHRLVCRLNGDWQRTTTRFHTNQLSIIETKGAWTSADTFTFRLCSTDSLYDVTFICRFVDDCLLRLQQHRLNALYHSVTTTEILGWRK